MESITVVDEGALAHGPTFAWAAMESAIATVAWAFEKGYRGRANPTVAIRGNTRALWNLARQSRSWRARNAMYSSDLEASCKGGNGWVTRGWFDFDNRQDGGRWVCARDKVCPVDAFLFTPCRNLVPER